MVNIKRLWKHIEIIIHIWNQDTSATLMCYLLHYVNTLSGYVDITYRSYCRTFSWCKITSYIVYPHIGRMLKPLSLPWSHSLITRYVVSPFQVKSQKFLHLQHFTSILCDTCFVHYCYYYCYVLQVIVVFKVSENGDFSKITTWNIDGGFDSSITIIHAY